MIMVVQPIIIIFQNRGQIFYGYLVGATDNCHYFPTIIVSAKLARAGLRGKEKKQAKREQERNFVRYCKIIHAR